MPDPFYLGTEDVDLTILGHIKNPHNLLAAIQVNRYVTNLVSKGWRGTFWKTILERKLSRSLPFDSGVNYRREFLKYLFLKVPKKLFIQTNFCCTGVIVTEESRLEARIESDLTIPEVALDLGTETLQIVKNRLPTKEMPQETEIHSLHIALCYGRPDVFAYLLEYHRKELNQALLCPRHHHFWDLDNSTLRRASSEKIDILKNFGYFGHGFMPLSQNSWIYRLVNRQNLEIFEKVASSLTSTTYDSFMRNALDSWISKPELVVRLISILSRIHKGTLRLPYYINTTPYFKIISDYDGHPLEVYQEALHYGFVFSKPPKIEILRNLRPLTLKAQRIWMKYALGFHTDYLKEKQYLAEVNPTLVDLIDPRVHYPSVISSYGLIFKRIPPKIYLQAFDYFLNQETSAYDPINKRKIYLKNSMAQEAPRAMKAWASILNLSAIRIDLADKILLKLVKISPGRTYEDTYAFVHAFFGSEDRLRPSSKILETVLNNLQKGKENPLKYKIQELLNHST